MIIRDVEVGDSEDLLNWRNDAVTRAMSKSNQIVTFDEHDRWLRGSLANRQIALYIGVINNEKVGVCSFAYKPEKSFSEVSINLNPAMRGRNLAYCLLKKSIERYREKNDIRLFATIRTQNLPSKRIFEKCDFRLSGFDNDFCYLLMQVDA